MVLGLSFYLKLVKRFGQLTLVPFQNLTIVKKELNILWKKEIPAVVPDLKLRPAPTETAEIHPNVPPWWTGSSSKIIKANSYVRHNFIQTLVI